jgi:outer membrane lipoprotein
MVDRRVSIRALVLAGAIWALCACTPAPVLRTDSAPDAVAPADAAALSEHFAGAQVVWGGEVLEVRNREQASEIVVLAYPLDRGQRPQRREASLGRFIALMPGYVERYDYPAGRYITIAGKLDGSRDELIGAQRYQHALLKADTWHLWPPDFDERHWHFGIGFGGSIR